MLSWCATSGTARKWISDCGKDVELRYHKRNSSHVDFQLREGWRIDVSQAEHAMCGFRVAGGCRQEAGRMKAE